MKISNSKRQLAQIIIENGGWRDGVEFCVSTCNGIIIGSKSKPKYTSKYGWIAAGGFIEDRIEVLSYLKNWHQTVLSRDEFDQIVAESVVPGELGVDGACGDGCGGRPDCGPAMGDATYREMFREETKPTLDQLLQDWRNADDYAQRKQAEADEAAAMRDERWQAVQDRAGETGVMVGRSEKVPEPVITDWRDLLDEDIIEITSVHSKDNSPYVNVIGGLASVVAVGNPSHQNLMVRPHSGCRDLLIDGFKFIRRP